MSKSVIVTGCAGFIGSHVCEKLLANGFHVVGIDNFDAFYPRPVKEQNLAAFSGHPNFIFYELDICEGLEAVKETGISAVIHLAAKAGVRPSIEDPAGYIRTNITGTQKVHAFMLQRNISKLVFASSSSVYGNNKKIPFSETDNVDNPISPYAFTKKAGELMNYTFHHLYKADVVNLRFFTVYGPRQRPDLAIRKFVSRIDKGEPVVMFGDGSTARDYTFIADTVSGIYRALLFCMNNTGLFTTLNLGNHKPVTLLELVEAIYSVMGREKNIELQPMQPGDVDITYADISKATEILQYNPATDIHTGLKKFVDWYRESSQTAL